MKWRKKFDRGLCSEVVQLYGLICDLTFVGEAFFEALTGYIVVVSLFIFIKKLKDRHWKEHLFVAAMLVFDIVGFIATVITLAGGLRNLITEIFGQKQRFIRFANYLTEVERVLTLYMNKAWREIDEIRSIVERVRAELASARDLVSPLLDRKGKGKKGFPKITNADRYAQTLEESQAAIGRYLGLLAPAALAHVAPALTVQEQNGNEDLDHAFALLLHEEQLREANPRDESSQAWRDEEIARALQEEEDARAMQEEEDEEFAIVVQASLDEEMKKKKKKNKLLEPN